MILIRLCIGRIKGIIAEVIFWRNGTLLVISELGYLLLLEDTIKRNF